MNPPIFLQKWFLLTDQQPMNVVSIPALLETKAILSCNRLQLYADISSVAGTGKAARQRNTVQGRIMNGTLFPNITRAIKRDIEAAAKTIFDNMQKSLESNFAFIENDITMALASAPQQSNDMDDMGREDEERRRGELAGEVQGLKRQHAEILASIADI